MGRLPRTDCTCGYVVYSLGFPERAGFPRLPAKIGRRGRKRHLPQRHDLRRRHAPPLRAPRERPFRHRCRSHPRRRDRGRVVLRTRPPLARPPPRQACRLHGAGHQPALRRGGAARGRAGVRAQRRGRRRASRRGRRGDAGGAVPLPPGPGTSYGADARRGPPAGHPERADPQPRVEPVRAGCGPGTAWRGSRYRPRRAALRRGISRRVRRPLPGADRAGVRDPGRARQGVRARYDAVGRGRCGGRLVRPPPSMLPDGPAHAELPFHRPFVSGREGSAVASSLAGVHTAGNGPFAMRCERYLTALTGSAKVLLTHSCTGALEMAALLAGIGPGDEVIMPSFTFVSTANAFVLRGATPVFVDVRAEDLTIDPAEVEAAVARRTRAIVPVHYG